MVDLVVDVSADDDPPNGHFPTKSSVFDALTQLLIGKPCDQPRPLGSRFFKVSHELHVLFASRDGHRSGVPDDGFERSRFEFPE
jgi:hypothetical protein